MTQNSPKKDSYRKDIDGLRAIAVVAVVLFHAHVAHVTGGFVGVDIFFVISGYLIGAHIYRDLATDTFSIARFYARRAKRILPALFTVLLFCLLLALLVLPADELRTFSVNAFATVLSVSNFYALAKISYFSSPVEANPLLMTWSLGVEEQFYIVFPLLMILIARLRRTATAARVPMLWIIGAVSLASFALSVVSVVHHRDAAFYMLPMRAWELGLGVLMALYEAQPATQSASTTLYGGARTANLRSILGFAAILWPVAHYTAATVFPGASALVPTLGAALLLSAPQAWINRRVLSSPPFRWIGLVSYSWYLWHWPLLSFARISADRPISVRVALGLLAVALVFAALTYRFVEQPFRKSTRAVTPLLLRYAGLVGVASLICFALHHAGGFPQRFPRANAADAVFSHYTHSCAVDIYLSKPIDSKECLPPPDGRPAAALLGDSHAAALSLQLRTLAAAQGMRLLTFNHALCPPILGVLDERNNPEADRNCSAFNHAALERILGDPTISTVVLVGNWAGPEEWGLNTPGYTLVPGLPTPHASSFANLQIGLSNMVDTLQHAGKQVILLQDYEALTFDPHRRILARLIPPRDFLDRLLQPAAAATPGFIASPAEMYTRENDEGAAVVEAVAQRFGVRTFDLRPGLCSPAGCLYSDGVHNLYFDVSHVTPRGAAIVLRGFRF